VVPGEVSGVAAPLEERAGWSLRLDAVRLEAVDGAESDIVALIRGPIALFAVGIYRRR